MIETGVSYFSSRDLRHVRRDLDEMVAAACTYVVHCFTETDLLYYRRTMSEATEATREAGLEAWVDPWGVTAIFSGESLSRFLVDQPDALQLLSDGRRAPAACPNHPATRRFLLDWVAAAAEAGGQVAFWDEPHFYIPLWRGDFSGAWACRCGYCADRFRQSAGGPLPARMDEQVRRFREASLVDLLAELTAEARRLGIRNAVALLPMDLEAVGLDELAAQLDARWRDRSRADGPQPADDNPRQSFGIRDWDAVGAIPDLDVFGTDPYWYLFRAEAEPFMRAFTRRAADVARRHERQLQLWVQAFAIPEGREAEIATGLRIAAEEGATHVAAWSYRATESMSSIRPARPDVVWEVVRGAFRELRGLPPAETVPASSARR